MQNYQQQWGDTFLNSQDNTILTLQPNGSGAQLQSVAEGSASEGLHADQNKNTKTFNKNNTKRKVSIFIKNTIRKKRIPLEIMN